MKRQGNVNQTPPRGMFSSYMTTGHCYSPVKSPQTSFKSKSPVSRRRVKGRSNKSEGPQLVIESPKPVDSRKVSKEISIHRKKPSPLIQETNSLRTAYLLEIKKLNEQIHESEMVLTQHSERSERKEQRKKQLKKQLVQGQRQLETSKLQIKSLAGTLTEVLSILSKGMEKEQREFAVQEVKEMLLEKLTEIQHKLGIDYDYEIQRLQNTPTSKQSSPQKSRSPTKEYCIAETDYQLKDPGHLSFTRGDIILITEKCQNGMWKGKLGKKTGKFPYEFVKIL